jgi:hypothetical protein
MSVSTYSSYAFSNWSLNKWTKVKSKTLELTFYRWLYSNFFLFTRSFLFQSVCLTQSFSNLTFTDVNRTPQFILASLATYSSIQLKIGLGLRSTTLKSPLWSGSQHFYVVLPQFSVFSWAIRFYRVLVSNVLFGYRATSTFLSRSTPRSSSNCPWARGGTIEAVRSAWDQSDSNLR